jgi:ribosomal protein S12 methylthiotransferase
MIPEKAAKRVSIVTLGCAKNTNDTENLAGLLKKQGFTVEADANKADAIVVHTCSFIDAAKRESVQTILEAAKYKNGSDKKLFVTGCMVQQHGKDMLAELPEVDAFLGTGQLAQIPDLLRSPRARFLDRTNPGGLTDPDAPREISHKGAMAYLRLSEGCGHPCSFCVIPKLRGGLQSRSEEKIVAEAKHLVAQGVEELVIIGQDTGDWGRDLFKEHRLPSLLRSLRDVRGVRWIRLMYMHPHSFSDELIKVFAESPEVFPYLDMPFQHIDNDLLMDMNRKLPEADLRRLLDKIHTSLPDLSLRTTFIVGYPGETEAQFEKLNDFVNEGHFDYLGGFAYSVEENTPAALKTNQLPDDVKKERHDCLMATYASVAYQKAQKRLGAKELVSIDDEEGEFVYGRTRKEAPEIDAVVQLPKSAARHGRFVEATLTGYDAHEFTAEVQ